MYTCVCEYVCVYVCVCVYIHVGIKHDTKTASYCFFKATAVLILFKSFVKVARNDKLFWQHRK